MTTDPTPEEIISAYLDGRSPGPPDEVLSTSSGQALLDEFAEVKRRIAALPDVDPPPGLFSSFAAEHGGASKTARSLCAAGVAASVMVVSVAAYGTGVGNASIDLETIAATHEVNVAHDRSHEVTVTRIDGDPNFDGLPKSGHRVKVVANRERDGWMDQMGETMVLVVGVDGATYAIAAGGPESRLMDVAAGLSEGNEPSVTDRVVQACQQGLRHLGLG